MEVLFRSERVPAEIASFSPLRTIAVGLAKRRVLEMQVFPPKLARHFAPVVLGTSAAEAVLFFLAVAWWFREGPTSSFWALVIATVAWGVLSLAASVRYLSRAARAEDQSAAPNSLEGIPFPSAGSLEEFLLLVAILLAAALVWFVLFVVWLPLLILLLAGVTLGEAWRAYRCVAVDSEPHDALARIGQRILEQGGTLSRSWDAHLIERDRFRAALTRNRRYRANQALAATGLSSLVLAASALLSVRIPWAGWTYTLLSTGLLTVAAAVSFFLSVLRIRRPAPHA